MNKEKRYSKRMIARNSTIALRPLDPKVWFRFWSGTDCGLRDISMVGIGIVCQSKMPVGTPLSIDLKLGKTGRIIRIFGKIAWVMPDKEMYRAGVSFSWWKEDQDRKQVGDFLQRLTAVN